MNGTAKPAARPYRRFIIPSMHRRFTNAAVFSLGLCLIEALCMTHFQGLWLSLGSVVIRTLLLFLCALAVFVLRVGNMHVGKRTTTPFFQQAFYTFLSSDSIYAFLWYIFSATFFCEVYMWSSSPSAGLAMVDFGRAYERPRLNERPIFLRTLFILLGMGQAVAHLIRDADRLDLPAAKAAHNAKDIVRHSQQPFVLPLAFFKDKAAVIFAHSIFRVFLTSILGPLFYWLSVRETAWSWSFWIAKHFFSLPRYSRPSTFPPGMPGLLGRFLVHGILLSLLWEITNTSFNLFMSQEPLKRGRLLTDESSDPNGSLLSGLKANRPIVKTYAFWELNLIASSFPARREVVYKDIDRAGGSAWSQILTVCLGEVHALVSRINESQGQKPEPSTQEAAPADLPRIAQTLKQDNILTAPIPVRFSTLRGDSPNAYNVVEKSATKLIEFTAQHTPADKMSSESVNEALSTITKTVLQSPLGFPFRVTMSQRQAAVVVGSPHSNVSAIVDAITSVSKLILNSKKEDVYGTVYRDISTVIRTYTRTFNVIDGFTQTTPVHWTDVYFKPQDRQVPEIQAILKALQDSLREIVDEFGEYCDDMGLRSFEMRAAKEVVARGGAEYREVKRSH